MVLKLLISLKHELCFFLITILLLKNIFSQFIFLNEFIQLNIYTYSFKCNMIDKLLSFLFIFCSFKEVFSGKFLFGKLLVLLSLLT